MVLTTNPNHKILTKQRPKRTARARLKDEKAFIYGLLQRVLGNFKQFLKLLCGILQEIKHDKIIILVTHSQALIEICDYVVNFNAEAMMQTD